MRSSKLQLMQDYETPVLKTFPLLCVQQAPADRTQQISSWWMVYSLNKERYSVFTVDLPTNSKENIRKISKLHDGNNSRDYCTLIHKQANKAKEVLHSKRIKIIEFLFHFVEHQKTIILSTYIGTAETFNLKQPHNEFLQY